MASIDWQVDADRRWSMRASPRASNRAASTAAPTRSAESTKYDPETVWSYEAGFKTTIANQLRLNGAVFYNDYKDFQARVSGIDDDPAPACPRRCCRCSTPASCASRAPSSKRPGRRSDGLLIDTQLGYLDADYKEFDDARFPLSAAAAPSRRPAFAPKWTLRLGAQYAFDLGRAGGDHHRRPDALPFAHRRSPSTIRIVNTDDRDRGPVPGRLLVARRADRLGEPSTSSSRSASTATIWATRPTRPTPRNSPASAASAPSITARRGRSRCSSRPATDPQGAAGFRRAVRAATVDDRAFD